MLISYSHQFIFFHIPKVAGTSVRIALDPYAHFTTKRLPNRILERFKLVRVFAKIPHYRYRAYGRHITVSDAREALPDDIFNNYYKFAFVRNPWEREVSRYHYILRTPNIKTHATVKSMASFEEYLHWRICEDMGLQRDFIADNNGELLVDFVGKFETLSQDLGKICSYLDLRLSTLPHLNSSQHDNYRKYYNSAMVDLIYKHFQADIELFDFSFA